MLRNRFVKFALVAAVLAGAGALGWQLWERRHATRAPVGSGFAPPFELADAKGALHRLEDLRGNVVVVHFWASWCPPCLQEIGDFVQAAQALEGKAVRFVAISLDPKWEDAHKVFPEDRVGKNMWLLLDSSLGVANDYGSYEFPETYVLSPDLKIAAKWIGPQNWADPKLREALVKLGNGT